MDRPECIKNIAEVAPNPYERPRADIAASPRDVGQAVGTRLIGVDVTEIPPGKKSSYLHRHGHKEEFFYVLSGECRIKIGDDLYPLKPGDAVSRPAGNGVCHQFDNPHDQPCSVMMIGVMAGQGVEDVIDWPELKRTLRIDADGKSLVRRSED